jgi:hypothetical protein
MNALIQFAITVLTVIVALWVYNRFVAGRIA